MGFCENGLRQAPSMNRKCRASLTWINLEAGPAAGDNGTMRSALLLVLIFASGAWGQPALHAPDVPYEPSAPEVVRVMLQLAQPKPGEILFDLGCGDGRVVIEAVLEYRVRGVCVDIDPARIGEARANAARAGVADRIRFINQDLFETDVRQADVVMLFLWPEVNLKLRPKLRSELKPGARVVSHWHDMGDWKPDRAVRIDAENRRRPVYFWMIR